MKRIHPMKTLIIEDEEALALVIQDKLTSKNHETRVVKDGDAAIAAARSFRPNLILLDLILPKKDGFAVLKELKADPELELIPVIVLSNLGEDENIKRALQLGAKDYFVKSQHPINEIVEKIESLRTA